MTTQGWIFMLLSVGGVTTLVSWCYYRVLTTAAEPPRPVEEFRSA